MASAAADCCFKIFAAADGFGQSLKDAVVAHLRSHPDVAEVVDLGTDKYYAAAASVARHVSAPSDPAAPEVRGVVVCGTGAGVSIFANKYPRVYATHCASPADAVNTRSINACNMAAIPDGSGPDSACAICCLRKGMEFEPVGIMPGGEMRIVRESPTSAYVRFKAGSVEPAHHHTFGHDLVVIKGKKKVWNLTKKESYDLVDGDFLFTPAADVHRVKYFEDTEFFIRWDGHWDIFLDEDIDTARSAIDAELGASGN
ncbi:hypothetical protein QOZ80_1BG0069950 [Eleusine coracana subsp. coracana]|nr:hypothetical protein QOZ80_1BG0069950 [Eleusine coracana subsp. coracana]